MYSNETSMLEGSAWKIVNMCDLVEETWCRQSYSDMSAMAHQQISGIWTLYSQTFLTNNETTDLTILIIFLWYGIHFAFKQQALYVGCDMYIVAQYSLFDIFKKYVRRGVPNLVKHVEGEATTVTERKLSSIIKWWWQAPTYYGRYCWTATLLCIIMDLSLLI